MKTNILIVDDDPSITTSLALLLKQGGYTTRSASSPSEALNLFTANNFDLVILDMNFSRQTTGEEGLKLLREFKNINHEVPVILITAWGSIGLAVEGMRKGASDFVTKPWTHQQILQSIKTILGISQLPSPPPRTDNMSRDDLDAQFDFNGIIGKDKKIIRTLELISRVAITDASVLITGESGCGKELIADAIHKNSHRRGKSFVKVNLGGIPPQLFESEMFGHVRGAFTDAKADRTGRFETADGGTIFLDEIGDLDSGSQVKLLRVLQDRTYEVLGSSKTRTTDVRVISATNRNLADIVARGLFREDLIYRLNLITIHVPALRDRIEDIPLLTQYFLDNLAIVYRREKLTITDSGLQTLMNYKWPGNIRQLRHTIERALLIANKDVLDSNDFEQTFEMDGNNDTKDSLPRIGSVTLDELEKNMIVKAMKLYDGNITKVAEALGLSRASLYRRFEKYNINI